MSNVLGVGFSLQASDSNIRGFDTPRLITFFWLFPDKIKEEIPNGQKWSFLLTKYSTNFLPRF